MDRRVGIVYLVTNTVNGKRYVGITVGTAEDRFKGHVNDMQRGSQLAFHCAIRRHGAEKFTVQELEECGTIEELKQRERDLIVELQTHVSLGRGYNMTKGGDGLFGFKHTESTKQIMSEKALARSPRSKEHSANISVGLQVWHAAPENQEQRRMMYDKRDMSYHDTPEYKAKISALHTGRKRPPEAGQNISRALKALGRKVPNETKRTISDKLKGNTNARKRIVQIDTNGMIVAVYPSTYAAAAAVGKISPGAIIACCKGRIPTAHGFTWQYAD